MQPTLFSPLTLPNGQVISNRLAKAAMEENLAAPGQVPSAEHYTLYGTWARGGAGLILTGNVMVAADHVTSPFGVVLDAKQPLEPFARWAEQVTEVGAQPWMQINHTGRMVRSDHGLTPLAPSAIGVQTAQGLWAAPEAMTEAQIARAIEQFTTTATLAAKAGFTGVQIHGAHGYLISQFLSPLSNQREDRWGGSLENRSRFLLEVLRAVRAALPQDVALGLKLNSADFQRGGFDQADAAQVVAELSHTNLDLLELSGGNVESPAMHGAGLPASTVAREAHFLELAAELVDVATMPLMLTGGVRSRAGAEQVLQGGIDLIGVGTALAMYPEIPSLWREGERRFTEPPHPEGVSGPVKTAQKQAWVRAAFRAHASGRPFEPERPAFEEYVQEDLARRTPQIEHYLSWLGSR